MNLRIGNYRYEARCGLNSYPGFFMQRYKSGRMLSLSALWVNITLARYPRITNL